MQRNSSNLAAFLAGAATALVAGGIFFYGSDGKRHRRQTEAFVERMKGNILERMEDVKDVSQDTYNRIVEEVVEDAGLIKALGRTKASRLAQKFKDRWQEMKDEAAAAAGQAELEMALEDDD